MSRRWILTVLGKDRPGIVAGVTKVLYQLGCNLEDSTMTRLEGEFASMLIFSGGAKATGASIQKAFEPLCRRMKLVVHLKALSKQETTPPKQPGKRHLISVYGADRSGIVFRVSETLANLGINIVDVQTHRTAPAGRRGTSSLYMMLLEVEVPPRVALSTLEQKLQQRGKALGVEVSVRAADADVL